MARTHADPYAEPFRVGIIATLGPYLLPKLLPALEQELPKLRVAIREGLTEDLLRQLNGRELDCVLLALPVDSANLSVAGLFDEPFWFAGRRDHPLADNKHIEEDDLRGREVLLLSEGHCLRDQALALCERRSAENAADTYRATSLETLRHLVSGGYGCTLLPALALGNELARGGPLKALPFRSARAARTIGLVWRRGFPRASALETLAKFISRRASKWLAEQQRRRTR